MICTVNLFRHQLKGKAVSLCKIADGRVWVFKIEKILLTLYHAIMWTFSKYSRYLLNEGIVSELSLSIQKYHYFLSHCDTEFSSEIITIATNTTGVIQHIAGWSITILYLAHKNSASSDPESIRHRVMNRLW